MEYLSSVKKQVAKIDDNNLNKKKKEAIKANGLKYKN